MYRTITDFLDDWGYEHEATVKVFSALTDPALAQRVTPKGRSLGKLAGHITVSLSEMISRTGLAFEGPSEDAPQPASASEITRTYKNAGTALGRGIQESWKDSDLDQKIEMYRGEQWEKRAVLLALIRHQIHHRAQMTVLMRQAGLRVAGCYGPSFEEWTEFGMTPQE
jgi:uncharacterized damage-inducible protein DinB